ncbi:MAG: nitroreductase family deazaflavin-dependent oxidoreductase [Acidimicrobiia bacterium]|nr:nitroreductase family deazaflavin-dependent oxidoreductase [Acidimicrobiia bacterium]
MTDGRSQRSRSFLTPPAWAVPWITRVNVWTYRRSGGRVGSASAGMRNVMVTTVGRRSGDHHTVVLPYWLDDRGHRIVVASYLGGPRHPAWFHNLADHQANPYVAVLDRDERFRARAVVLDGAERDEVWAALIADRPFYADYQAKTDRVIPLVRLVPLG